MVYLSELKLDPRRPGVLKLLGDTYMLHQALARAFPDREEGGMGRILFRVEAGSGPARILVQSDKEPDWSRLEFPVCACGPKELHFRLPDGRPVLSSGQLLRFRLRANPTVKRRFGADSKNPGHRRVGLHTAAEQCAWLERKGCEHGFELVPVPQGNDWYDPFLDADESSQPRAYRKEVQISSLGKLPGIKPGAAGRIQHFAVDFNGVLRVTDPEKFVEALEGGIGSAKGFGFGLLSVAKQR
jgi:CRISPR system Cascade subunit CasE